ADQLIRHPRCSLWSMRRIDARRARGAQLARSQSTAPDLRPAHAASWRLPLRLRARHRGCGRGIASPKLMDPVMADISVPGTAGSVDVGIRSDADLLRLLVVAAGLGCSILFVVVGLRYGLEMYADGSAFSYAVAVQDSWAFHWHNISGRLFVYLFS